MEKNTGISPNVFKAFTILKPTPETELFTPKKLYSTGEYCIGKPPALTVVSIFIKPHTRILLIWFFTIIPVIMQDGIVNPNLPLYQKKILAEAQSTQRGRKEEFTT
jgi:hypothetical protein